MVDYQAVKAAITKVFAGLGALPENLQTAHGSMTVGVGVKPGDTVLVRGLRFRDFA